MPDPTITYSEVLKAAEHAAALLRRANEYRRDLQFCKSVRLRFGGPPPAHTTQMCQGTDARTGESPILPITCAHVREAAALAKNSGRRLKQVENELSSLRLNRSLQRAPHHTIGVSALVLGAWLFFVALMHSFLSPFLVRFLALAPCLLLLVALLGLLTADTSITREKSIRQRLAASEEEAW